MRHAGRSYDAFYRAQAYADNMSSIYDEIMVEAQFNAVSARLACNVDTGQSSIER